LIAVLLASSVLLAYTPLNVDTQSNACFRPGFLQQYVDVVPVWLAGAKPTYVIVDPYGGRVEEPWTADDLAMLKDGGCKVIAYLNVGCAETWRSYWREEWGAKPPEWIGPENPDWPGEYYVKFWREEWQEILLGELDEIVSMGFNGVHLDNVDVCEFWRKNGVLDANQRMITLIERLSTHAKSRNPEFIVIANLGEAVELVLSERFLSAVDAVKREGVWYSDDKPIPPEENVETLKLFRRAKENGKLVFVLDYLQSPNHVEDFYEKCSLEGFLGYAPPSNKLNRLPETLPIYRSPCTLDLDGDQIVIWSYRGPGNQQPSHFEVYVGRLNPETGTVDVIHSFHEEGRNLEPVSAAYNSETGLVLTAWESSTGENAHVEVCLMQIGKREIQVLRKTATPARLSQQHTPAVASLGNGFLVAYVDAVREEDTDIRAVLVDADGDITKTISLASTSMNEFYPMAVACPYGVAVAYIIDGENKKRLGVVLVGPDRIAWRRTIELGGSASSYCIAIAQLGGKLALLAREDSRETTLVLLDPENGKELHRVQGLPPLQWWGRATAEKTKIAYATPLGVAIFSLDEEAYTHMPLDEHTSSAGTQPILHGDKVFLISAEPSENCPKPKITTLNVEREKAEPKLETTSPSKLIAVTVSAVTVSALAVWVLKRRWHSALFSSE